MKYIIITFIFVTSIFANIATAANLSIVATVDDKAISQSDIDNRLNLVLFSSGITNVSEARKRFSPQLTSALIDELLYKKEANNLRITLSPEEIKAAIANLEEKNKIQPGHLEEFLRKHNVSLKSITDKIEADLLWNKIISTRIAPQIIVTDTEVRERIEAVKQNDIGTGEVNISEIVLNIPTPESEKSVLDTAYKLTNELTSGANFAEMARQFSKSPSASSGGSLGWLDQNQLSPLILENIRSLKIGQVTKPIFLGNGYSILKLNDVRAMVSAEKNETEYGIKHASISLKSQSAKEIDRLKKKIESAAHKINKCDDFEKFSRNIKSDIEPTMNMFLLSSFSKNTANIIKKTSVGNVTPVIKNEHSLDIYMVCEKTEAQPSIATRNKIKNSIFQQKLDVAIRSYIQNLRRNAFIEIRNND